MFSGESEEIELYIARYLRNKEKNSLNFVGTKKIEAIFWRGLYSFLVCVRVNFYINARPL
jgi:hypothetical protein